MNNWFAMIILQSFILISLPAGFADHGGNVLQCVEDEIWDPNTDSCVKTCPAGISNDDEFNINGSHCKLIKFTIGGELIPLDSTALLMIQTQSNAAWLIPIIVSAVGIGIALTRRF